MNLLITAENISHGGVRTRLPQAFISVLRLPQAQKERRAAAAREARAVHYRQPLAFSGRGVV